MNKMKSFLLVECISQSVYLSRSNNTEKKSLAIENIHYARCSNSSQLTISSYCNASCTKYFRWQVILSICDIESLVHCPIFTHSIFPCLLSYAPLENRLLLIQHWHDIIRTRWKCPYLQVEFFCFFPPRLKSTNSFILSLSLIRYIRKALDCVNSTQKKCKWKQHWSSRLTFDSSFFFSRPTNFLSREKRERERRKNAMLSTIASISSPIRSLLLLLLFLFSLLNIDIQKNRNSLSSTNVARERRRANIIFVLFTKVEKYVVEDDIHMSSLFDIEHWLEMSTSTTASTTTTTSWSFSLR